MQIGTRMVPLVDAEAPHMLMSVIRAEILAKVRKQEVATPERFELPTVSLGRTCSIQLSYGACAEPELRK